MSDREPVPVEPHDDTPMWDSDIEEREARRRKMMIFGGSAVAVLVGFVGLYAALSWIAGGLTGAGDPTPSAGVTNVVTEGTDAPAPPPDQADPVGAGELDWYAIDSPLGFSSRLLASNTGNFYALSTVPGNAVVWPAPKAIYKSGDGENWEIISLDDTQSGHDMALLGDTLYLIGTSPANQDFQKPAEVLVSSSSDGGDSWSQTQLATVSAPPDGAPVSWANVTLRIGASSNTVVAVVQSQYFLDYSQMVPPEWANPSYGFQAQADGVQVIDHQALEELYIGCEEGSGEEFDELSDECQALFNGDESAAAVGFVTWEEMGLADGSEPVFSEMFVSTAGGGFEAIESPFEPGSELQALHASANGFIGVEFGGQRQRVWLSDDGRTWREDEQLRDFDWIVNVGVTNGRTVVVGQSGNDSLAAWSSDDGKWQMVNINDIVPGGNAGPEGGRFLSAAAVGPLGVAAVFQSFDEIAGVEATQVALASSPEDWSVVRLDEITGMAGGYSSSVAVGTNAIIISYEVFTQFEPRSLQVIGARAAT